MNRLTHHTAFALGLLAIAWVAAGYIPGNPLALALVLPIGAVYLMGALELRRFQQATSGLGQALAATTQPPPALDGWIEQVPAGLRTAVRLRVEGDRVALPGPALTPYLAGLLVLLGMLGTFLGMVVTLKGTGLALENATDVEAIRASLAAPVKGLGLAFGSSVAGVAASAMLGLMSALARRDRQRVVLQLDSCTASTLRGFSRAHQREQALRLQQAQADLMPALVSQLQGLATQLAQQGLALNDRLLDSQQQLQASTQRAYQGLADSVDRTLKASLADSARLAGAAIEPAVQRTLAGLALESSALRETLAAAVQQQLVGFAQHFEQRSTQLVDGVAERLDRSAGQTAAHWAQAAAVMHDGQARLVQHTRDAVAATVAGFEQQATALLHDVGQALAQQARAGDDALAQRQQQICATLERSAQAITTQAEAHARNTLAEISQLVQAAAQAPRAAADVIGELRLALSDSLLRDNAALDERNRLLATLGSLLDAVNHAGTEQRAAIDALLQSTSDMLDRVGARFAGSVDAGSGTLQAVADQVTGSAAEVASLGEGFGAAVQLFSSTSQQLMGQLQRIEAALGQSLTRSDEQLAYYVAQAREIIDLTLGSHKQIVDDLQQLARVPTPALAPAGADAAEASAA